MKTKRFQEYLEERLSKEEIREIEAQARSEVKILRSLQKLIADTMNAYMKKNKVGFNDLVRRLDWSPTKVAKIQRGESNLTLASLAQLFALLEKDPSNLFKRKK